jgi:hypothetical protein
VTGQSGRRLLPVACRPLHLVVVATALLIAGCASTAPAPPLTAQAAGSSKPFDCKAKRGSLQIAILQYRSVQGSGQPSGLARSMTSMFSGSLGTPSKENIGGSGLRASVVDLQSANEELKANNCRAFDLSKEINFVGS